ncbi:hypothetical protein HU200_035166 [Digitaria exilis]|uniref:Uncharacterized protein n=1 Tax=Digitaria exilis TaxID=1010633 RepID=A0A835BFH9_9POAL|nr:hypothetical protein HU200_035166 [Digitaria exilis]
MQLVVAFLVAVAATTLQPLAASALPSAPAGAEQAEVEFVRGCCARTLYPRLCCAGLAPHAASVHYSHARLDAGQLRRRARRSG